MLPEDIEDFDEVAVGKLWAYVVAKYIIVSIWLRYARLPNNHFDQPKFQEKDYIFRTVFP